MSYHGFRASKSSLVFIKGTTSTQTFNIEWDPNYSLEVQISHNLPNFFEVEPGHDIINYPCELRITYNSDLGRHIMLKTEIWIEFSATLMRRRLHRQIIVPVYFVESPFTSILNKKEQCATKSEILDCKVCLLAYSDQIDELLPVILTGCGHTLCKNCAIKIQQSSVDKRSVSCPFDRKVTHGNVEKLPKNFAIIDLIRERYEKSMKPKICEDPDIPCYENSRHEASLYCKSCEQDYCEACFQIVHTSKILSAHEAIPIDEKPFVVPECSIHPGNLITSMCKTENCSAESPLCCNQCLTDTHETHQTEPIMMAVDRNKSTLSEILKRLELQESEFFKQLGKAKGIVKIFDKSSSNYTRTHNEITDFYDEQKRIALEKLEHFVFLRKGDMEDEAEQIEIYIKRIVDTRREIEKKLKKKETLMTKEIIEKGNEMCDLKLRDEDFFDSFNFPSRDDIIDIGRDTPSPSSSISLSSSDPEPNNYPSKAASSRSL